jgi:hypothetical protein
MSKKSRAIAAAKALSALRINPDLAFAQQSLDQLRAGQP